MCIRDKVETAALHEMVEDARRLGFVEARKGGEKRTVAIQSNLEGSVTFKSVYDETSCSPKHFTSREHYLHM